MLAGAVLALDLLGVTALVGAVLGTAGVLGLAVGFAFRDIVENYLAGIILSLRQPFAPQDLIQIANHEGRVMRLTGRETILMMLDGNHVRIPNATVFKSVMVNLTRNPRRRFVIQVGIAPWEDVTRALEVGRGAVESVPGTLQTPAPAARIQELAASPVELRFSGWIDQTEADFQKVRSEVIRELKEASERAGVETPPPEFGLRMLEAAPPAPHAPKRPVAPPRATAAPDVAPDTTIEEEIARALEASTEENLLTPPPDAPESPPRERSTRPGG